MNHHPFFPQGSLGRFRQGSVACGLASVIFLGQLDALRGNPSGGLVEAGSASIGSAGTTLTINQSSLTAVINWQQFSIANGETTAFIVPTSSSATLNRVVGGNPSAIYGTLQSNGVLYLVNPSGIVVGPGGRIDTAGFLGSTLNVSNQEFLKRGDLNFSGASEASIVNEGTIHSSSGDVYLIANQVDNEGRLSAPHGNVGLAAGTDVLFQQAGDQHLFVQSTPARTRARGVNNAGTIQAAAAELRAAGGNAYALAINNTGSIVATGFRKIGGQVYLTADGGNITNSGQISARSHGSGGTVVLDGSTASTSSGKVTNSGTLDASATAANGHGGTVTLKDKGGATENTASGRILAAGGVNSQGGSIETSGDALQINGTVNAGKGGQWLLDPGDVVIDNGDGVAPDVNVTTLETALNAGTNETVQASGGNTDSGNIDLDAALSWMSGAILQLTASGAINLTQALHATAGTLSLSAVGSITDTAELVVSKFILQNGSWAQNSATLPAFTASHDFELQNSSKFLRVTGGNGTSTPYQVTDIYGLEGLGSPSGSFLGSNAELMNNIDATSTSDWNSGAGFVPIGGSGGYYSGTFNGQSHVVNGLVIDTPDATLVGLFGVASGVLENLVLTNVQVTGSSAVGGLSGSIGNANSGTPGTGSILDVSVSGTISGGAYVGGLDGYDHGTSVSDSSTSGTINGNSFTGGLEGSTLSSLSNDFSTASVNATSVVGGLVGENYYGGVIHNSYSIGAISGSSETGGLVGRELGAANNSFWDTTTSGIGTSAAGIGASTTQLESQAYILDNAPVAPTWDFTQIWTTHDGTTTPRLIALTGTGSDGGSNGGSEGGNGGSGGFNGGGLGGLSNPRLPSTATGGAANSGSDLVPPVLNSPPPLVINPASNGNLGNTPPLDLLSFQGAGLTVQKGQEDGGLASASGNGGIVGPGDGLEMGQDGINNTTNPQAADAMSQALGPIVYSNLADALKNLGDWVDVPTDTTDGSGNDETILTGGQVAEMDTAGVKQIPANQAPEPLQKAMGSDVLQGLDH